MVLIKKVWADWRKVCGEHYPIFVADIRSLVDRQHLLMRKNRNQIKEKTI